MAIGWRLLQHPHEIVSLDGWEPDNEFPIGPQGAKPKRILICPTPAPHPFLIGGHRYLFKEPGGVQVQQVWSEAIAYEISRWLHHPVPPAFLARGPRNGSPGVLIEFFYGYQCLPEQRFVHAIEMLQGAGFPVDFDRGSLRDNLTLCRLLGVPEWREWWARTLILDALIGNTDRHSENWGFLIARDHTRLRYSLAPAFDNGTSLGFIVREEQLSDYRRPEQLHRFIMRGRHHCGWVSGDHEGAQHAHLCKLFFARFKMPIALAQDALGVTDTAIDALVARCASFPFEVPFSDNRARFVAALLKARRDALASALGA